MRGRGAQCLRIASCSKFSYRKNKCFKGFLVTLGQELSNAIEIKSISCQTPELCSCKVVAFCLETPK